MDLTEYLDIGLDMPFSIKSFSKTLFKINRDGFLDYYYEKDSTNPRGDAKLFQALSHLIKHPDSVDPYYVNLSAIMEPEEYRYLKYLYTDWGVEKIWKASEKEYYIDDNLVKYNLFPSMPIGYYNLREALK